MAGNAGLFDGDDADDGDQNSAPSPFQGAAADAMRAKIGRPSGSRNKRDRDFERWYFAKGFIDPAQRLAELMSEDPRVLQAWLEENAGLDSDGKKRTAPTILEVIRMQISAAGELMPYLHGKKPIEIAVVDERLPTLIIVSDSNQLAEAKRILGQRQALSLGTVIEASEIKDLEGGE